MCHVLAVEWGGGIAPGVALVTALLAPCLNNAFGQNLSLQLEASNYNGFAVSCFGSKDGSIDLTVTGGTPPYTYEWSNGASTQDLTGLSAGYYRVGVSDNYGGFGEAEITLEQPERLVGSAVAYEYPNEFNISCHSCFNGSIDASASGGVMPYSFLWQDGTTTEDRSGLGARDYTATVTDANECESDAIKLTLREPERNDWTMTGNAGTSPLSQFVGTTDNQDLVFRTNNVERLRLTGSGGVQASSLGSASGYKLLMADSLGVMKGVDIGTLTQYVAQKDGCPAGETWPWFMCGNSFARPDNFIGTTNAVALKFRTNNEQRMMITADGKVGIGTIPPSGAVGQYRLFVEDGIVTRDVLVRANAWPDFVFGAEYDLMPLADLRDYLDRHQHLPGIPSAQELETQHGVELGDMQRRLVQVVEEQTLYILQLEEAMRSLEQRLKDLETSK